MTKQQIINYISYIETVENPKTGVFTSSQKLIVEVENISHFHITAIWSMVVRDNAHTRSNKNNWSEWIYTGVKRGEIQPTQYVSISHVKRHRSYPAKPRSSIRSSKKQTYLIGLQGINDIDIPQDEDMPDAFRDVPLVYMGQVAAYSEEDAHKLAKQLIMRHSHLEVYPLSR